MSAISEALAGIIAKSPAGWSEADKLQAILAAEDLAVLAARSATGEDVAEELALAAASAKNIAARAAVSSARAVHEAILGAITQVAGRALLAAI